MEIINLNFRIILSLFFDQECLLCGKLSGLSSQYGLCRRCFSKLIFFKPDVPRCTKCSRSLISEKDICMRCRKENFSFDHNYSFWNYYGDIKKIIGFYKFHGIKILADFFALKIHIYLKEKYKNTKILLVPAPCSSARIKKFGFNHMQLIAHILHKKYKYPVFKFLSRRKGMQLKKLTRQQRKAELQNKIYIPDKKIRLFTSLAEQHIVIFLDDIFTTGTTASLCSSVLLKNGASRVDIITLALD